MGYTDQYIRVHRTISLQEPSSHSCLRTNVTKDERRAGSLKRMTDSDTLMRFCRQPQVLPPPTTTGAWAGFDPELIDTNIWSGAPAVSLAIDRVVREALGAGLTLRETYQEVRSTLHAQGVHPDEVDLDQCIKDHVLLAI